MILLETVMFKGHIRYVIIVNYGEQQPQRGFFSNFSCDCIRIMMRIKVTTQTSY